MKPWQFRKESVLISLASLVFAFSLSRCGSGDKDKKAKEQSAATPSDDLPEGGAVPSGWDGVSDWSQSAFEVIDE